MSSSILTYIYSLIPFTSLFNLLYDKVIKVLYNLQINAICIPYIDPSLLNNLVSTSCYLVNLDAEVGNTLDEDEKNQASLGALISPRIIYTKCIAIVNELKDVILNSSNSITQFIFISIDYRLLKYSGTGSKILNALPSDQYYQILKLQPDWNDALYDKIKNDLVTRKSSKLVIYNNLLDLQSIICKNFNSVTVKI